MSHASPTRLSAPRTGPRSLGADANRIWVVGGSFLLSLGVPSAIPTKSSLSSPYLLDGGRVHGLDACRSCFIFILTVVACTDLLTLRAAPANCTNPRSLAPPLAMPGTRAAAAHAHGTAHAHHHTRCSHPRRRSTERVTGTAAGTTRAPARRWRGLLWPRARHCARRHSQRPAMKSARRPR